MLANKAKEGGAISSAAKINERVLTKGQIRPSRIPDYDLSGYFDLKPFENSAHAFDNTAQFQDIFKATGNIPAPLYYRLW